MRIFEQVKSRLILSNLPEGTVTFSFTDIKGSTTALSQLHLESVERGDQQSPRPQRAVGEHEKRSAKRRAVLDFAEKLM
jgi:hypothetical protein